MTFRCHFVLKSLFIVVLTRFFCFVFGDSCVRTNEDTPIQCIQCQRRKCWPVLSVLMYAAETCTLLAADTRALEDFHVRCQRQILGVRWFDFIRNDEIALHTGLLPITDLTRSKTPAFSIFSHRPSVCQRLFQPTKPHAATSMHHSVDHLITHGNVDQTTTGWSTSVRTPAFLNQLIYGVGPSSADTERRYGLGWLLDDDNDSLTVTGRACERIAERSLVWM